MFTGTLVRWVHRDVAIAQQDPAGGRKLETADHPQGRGLATARRPEQREEFARLDVEGYAVDRPDGTEALLQVDEADLGGGCVGGGRHRGPSLRAPDARQRTPSRSPQRRLMRWSRMARRVPFCLDAPPKGSAGRDEGSRSQGRTGRPMSPAGCGTDAPLDPPDRGWAPGGHDDERTAVRDHGPRPAGGARTHLRVLGARPVDSHVVATVPGAAAADAAQPATPCPARRPPGGDLAPPPAGPARGGDRLTGGPIDRPRSYDRGHGRPDRHLRDRLPRAGARDHLRGARRGRARQRRARRGPAPRPSRHQRRGGYRQDAPGRGAAPDGGRPRLPRPVGIGHRSRRWRRAVRGARRSAPTAAGRAGTRRAGRWWSGRPPPTSPG